MSLLKGRLPLRAAIAVVTLSLLITPGTAAIAVNGSDVSMPATAGATTTVIGRPATETLPALIKLGLKASPEVKAKRLEWRRALERYPQAVSLPDPVLAYTQPIHEIETRLGPNKRSAMLSQDFPFPGTLKTRGRIAGAEAQIARLALDKAMRQLVLDIKKTYFELYYLDRASVLAEEKTRLFRHLTKARRNDYSVDSIDFSDVIDAQTRFADAEYELILLSELREAAAGRLNTLLNRDPESNIGPLAEARVEAPDARLQELYKKIKNNEEMLAGNLLIEKGVLKEKLARKGKKLSINGPGLQIFKNGVDYFK